MIDIKNIYNIRDADKYNLYSIYNVNGMYGLGAGYGNTYHGNGYGDGRKYYYMNGCGLDMYGFEGEGESRTE
jgi:hypothetical protein